MAECKIYLFGESITRGSDSSATNNTALIYNVDTWGDANSAGRTQGFIPNTPARSSIVNTAIAQNNIVSYVVANVLTKRVNSTSNTPPDYDFTTDIPEEGSIQAVADAWIETLTTLTEGSNFLLDNEVVTSKIANSAVTTDKIQDSAVTTDKIADSTGTQDGIITSKIANSAITTEKIANNAITTDKISTFVAGNSNTGISTAKIQDSAVTTAKIADSAVTTVKIQDSAVTTVKIQDSAITNDKVATDAGITSDKINFSGGISGIGGWSIVVSGSYLEFRYDGTWKFRISTSGDVITP